MTVAIMPVSIALSIVLIGVLYTAISVLLQRKLINPKRMRELQQKSKDITTELNRLVKANAPKEHIEAKQKELMPMLSESMRSQMKPMFVILPIFLVMYYLILPTVFASSTTSFFMFTLFGAKEQLGLRGLFFYTVLIIGIIASISILVYDKKKTKLERAERAAAANGQPQIPSNQVADKQAKTY